MSATRTTLPVSDVHVEPGLNHRSEEEVAALRPHGNLRPNAGVANAFQRICRKPLPPSLYRSAAELAERETQGENAARAA